MVTAHSSAILELLHTATQTNELDALTYRWLHGHACRTLNAASTVMRT